MAKKATTPKAFGDSDTDRRVSGLADRRLNTSDYKFREYPKMVYHKDGQQSRIVTDEAGHKALGADWGADAPEIHADDASHEAAVLKGDGVVQPAAARVEVVNPREDRLAAAFQQPGAPVDASADDDAKADTKKGKK
jgi:hypothetical protein